VDGGAPVRKAPKPKRGAKAPEKGERIELKAKRKTSGKGGDLTAKFNGWVDEGFFQKLRTLAEVRDRFHEQGDIIPRTTIPTYLLAAVRARPPRLTRTKADVNGKKVWVYTNPS
jgi:hypothetical protein